MAHIQAQNLQKVQKIRYEQKVPEVNGLTSGQVVLKRPVQVVGDLRLDNLL